MAGLLRFVYPGAGYCARACGFEPSDAPKKWEADGRPSYMHSSYMPSGVKYVNHHSINDWALDSWELNQKLKRAIGYHYGWVCGIALGSEDRFFSNLAASASLLCPHERPSVRAVGKEGRTGSISANSLNLSSCSFSEPGGQNGFGDEHSAQFTRRIQHLKAFYTEIMKKLELPFNP